MAGDDDIPEASGSDSKKTSSSGGADNGDYGDLQEIGEDADADGEMQRVIICYKKADKQKLEQILGTDITKILYNINDLIDTDADTDAGEEQGEDE